MPGKKKNKNVVRIGLPCPTCGESIKEGQKAKIVNSKRYHATKKCLPKGHGQRFDAFSVTQPTHIHEVSRHQIEPGDVAYRP